MKKLKESGEKIGMDLSKLKVVRPKICGFGVKGPGCFCYNGNWVRLDKTGELQLPEHFKLKRKRDDKAFIVDKRFENQKGLMLAIPHQQWMGHPVGGDSIVNFLLFERENLLIKHGANLSTITTGVIPLLSKKEVPELCTEHIAITFNVVLDDSRRIGMFLNEELPLEGLQEAYRQTIPVKYTTDDYKPTIEEAVDRHWTLMCRNIGRNFRAMFDAGLNNPHDQNIGGNISLDGGLCDTLDLARMRNPREFHSTMVDGLGILALFYQVAGNKKMEFFASPYFKVILDELVGREEAGKLAEQIRPSVKPSAPGTYAVKFGKAVGLVTDTFLKSKGFDEKSVWQMANVEFLILLEGDEALRKKVNFAKKPRHVQEELDGYRSTADLHLRCKTAMSMAENVAELKREYEQKFSA